MERPYIDSKTFKKLSKEGKRISLGEYEDCIFQQCDLSTLKLDHYIFINCEFVECDLSNATLHGTAFQHCVFKECKLMGLQFDVCNSFGLEFHFYESILNHCSFQGLNLQKSSFLECSMIDVNMEAANLSKVSVKLCNLENAIFFKTNLSESNFTGSHNFSIDLNNNNISKMTVSQSELEGFLRNHKINVV